MKKNRLLSAVSFVIIAFALLVETITIYELHAYEDAFLELYAMEQDGYLQVTIDQIKRLPKDASSNDITRIISSIDASLSKYWMLSKDDNIMFLKSVTETDRYKSYTASSYLNSASAVEFVDAMQVGKVNHAIIDLEDGRYVASGGRFEFAGDSYNICLLTYDHAILDKNKMLESKNSIIVFISILVAVLTTSTMIWIRTVINLEHQVAEMEANQILMNQIIENLDNTIKAYDAYSPSRHVFAEEVIPEFLDKMDENNIFPIGFVLVCCDSKEVRNEMLESIQLKMDDRVIRFKIGESDVLLIFVGYMETVMLEMSSEIRHAHFRVQKIKYVDSNYNRYVDVYKKFMTDPSKYNVDEIDA